VTLSEEIVILTEPVDEFSVPWTVHDTWWGLGLFVMLIMGIVATIIFSRSVSFIQNTGLIIIELLYLVPVAVILARRRAPWKMLGFRPFDTQTLGIGCGLLVGAYMIIILHNVILSLAGFITQGESIFQFLGRLENPLVFVFAGIVLAPIVEEIFFRGFLFNGFRQRLGWNKAALLSSLFFSLAHMEPVALIPTFILGYLLAYLFHRSNSLWPGVVLHCLVNFFGFCMIYTVLQIPV
jgi:hypothetical protein